MESAIQRRNKDAWSDGGAFSHGTTADADHHTLLGLQHYCCNHDNNLFDSVLGK